MSHEADRTCPCGGTYLPVEVGPSYVDLADFTDERYTFPWRNFKCELCGERRKIVPTIKEWEQLVALDPEEERGYIAHRNSSK